MLHEDVVGSVVDVETEAVDVGDLAVEAAKMKRKNGVYQQTLDFHRINQGHEI